MLSILAKFLGDLTGHLGDSDAKQDLLIAPHFDQIDDVAVGTHELTRNLACIFRCDRGGDGTVEE